MFRYLKAATRIAAIAALASTAVYVWPIMRLTAQYAWIRVARLDDAETIAALRIQTLSEADYANEIDTALNEQDPELARSIVELARQTGHPVPPVLEAKVTEAESFSFSRTASESWTGLTEGNADTPAAFAGTLAADLTFMGDARDLYNEAAKYPHYDEITVGLATVGIAATVATWASAMQSTPIKAGVSMLKSLKKANKLPRGLEAELKKTLEGAIDMEQASRVFKDASNFDIKAVSVAIRKIIRPDALKKLETASENLGNVASTQGYRGTVQTLKAAETMDDLRRMKQLSNKFGNSYRAVLKFVMKAGGFSLRFAALLAWFGWQAVLALLWFIAALLTCADIVIWTARRAQGLVRAGS